MSDKARARSEREITGEEPGGYKSQNLRLIAEKNDVCCDHEAPVADHGGVKKPSAPLKIGGTKPLSP